MKKCIEEQKNRHTYSKQAMIQSARRQYLSHTFKYIFIKHHQKNEEHSLVLGYFSAVQTQNTLVCDTVYLTMDLSHVWSLCYIFG